MFALRPWDSTDTKDLLKGVLQTTVPSFILGTILHYFTSFLWASIIHGLIMLFWWMKFWCAKTAERTKMIPITGIKSHRSEDLQLCPVRCMQTEKDGFYLLILMENRIVKAERKSWHAKMGFGTWNEALIDGSFYFPRVIAMSRDPFPEKQQLVAQVLPLPLAQMVINYIIPARGFLQLLALYM